MLDEMLGAYGSNLTIAMAGVAAGLLCLILVLWLMRGRGGPSPFLRGGKNRQPRLQVLDAAAVDTRRRLVLVRRDDVEHLIMIGGPTDIVIESSIVDGRSPPYHTLMKTVSAPEPAAVADSQAPPALASRPTALSSPSPQDGVRKEPADAQETQVEEGLVQQSPVKDRPLADGRGQRAREAEVDVRDRQRAQDQPAGNETFAWVQAETTASRKPVGTADPSSKPSPVIAEIERTRPPQTAAAEAAVPRRSEPLSIPVAPLTVNITPQAEPRPTQMEPVAPAAASAPDVELSRMEPRSGMAASTTPRPIATAFTAVDTLNAGEPDAAPSPITKSMPAPPISIDEPARPALQVSLNAQRRTSEPASVDNAVDLLEAARGRVFQQAQPETAPVVSVDPAPVTFPVPTPGQRPSAPPVQTSSPITAPRPAAAQSTQEKPLGSDFERILEEEMASNLAAGNVAPPIGPAVPPAPASSLPRRDPGFSRVTGATPEPTMQNEIARIFGEMSVTKDDR
ncbi:hypothetical protein ACQKKX_09970 [Neorhizobium sp. NPDC001467]|uniref:hypothetical protein n=1 Tax=Neorhizobium sp. NPDC001467 TaxID=3390595 RepID=UPI003D06A93D